MDEVPSRTIYRCIELGCDREPAAGDTRCELHISRLGSSPRKSRAAQSSDAITAETVAPEHVLDSNSAPTTELPDGRKRVFIAWGTIIAALAAIAAVETFSLMQPRRTSLANWLAFWSWIALSFGSPVTAGFCIVKARRWAFAFGCLALASSVLLVLFAVAYGPHIYRTLAYGPRWFD